MLNVPKDNNKHRIPRHMGHMDDFLSVILGAYDWKKMKNNGLMIASMIMIIKVGLDFKWDQLSVI